MRMKMLKAVRKAARWIGVLLAVRLPMDKIAGLRTR